MQNQVSRRPTERATKPFERVFFDIIHMTPAYNGDKWASHFLCESTHVHHGFTHKKKSGIRQSVVHYAAFVERQFDTKVCVFHSDGEKSMEQKNMGKWIKSKGYKYETTAPYTPAQNGPSERSGAVIMRRARAMRIEARLPEDLWPELFYHAIKILNLTPTEQLGWLTPIETLMQALRKPNPRPSGFNLYITGSRVYVKINKVPKTKKVAPRALIGYLVGYDSTNIFRVWIPQQNKVIRVRNATIDESKLFDPTKPFLEEELLSTVPTRRQVLEIPSIKERSSHRPFGTEETSSEESSTEDDDDDIQQTQQEPNTETSIAPDLQDSYLPPTPEYFAPVQEAIEPTKEIIADIDERNIIQGSRRRKPTSRRREAFLAELDKPEELPGFYSAFATGTTHRDRIHRDQLPPEPKNWRSLLAHPYRKEFKEAADKEIAELKEKDTFIYVNRPREKQVLPITWVFRYKFDNDGFLTKFKARLCVCGNFQKPNLLDTYAATLAAKVFRALMAITSVFDLETLQLDVRNAFVHSTLDEEVYCENPEGLNTGNCIRLQKALYGLRRAPRLWQQNLTKKLCELNLRQIAEEPCVFTNDFLIFFFFVDDTMILFHRKNRSKVLELKDALLESFDVQEIGEVKWFLGVRVLRDRPNRKLWLCQDSYVDKITHRFNLQHMRPPKTPMTTEPLTQNPAQASPQNIHLFQQKVGSLLYATTITRPDVARTANKLSEFMNNPSPEHFVAVDRAIGYLYGTRSLAIEYSRDSEAFLCASDAAFADNVDRKSTEGFLFKLFGGPIDWRASKQKTITTSTTEAELLALSHTTKEFYWWKRLFKDIGLDLEDEGTTPVLCDNQQTVGLLQKEQPIFKTQLKHVDVHHHWLRQEVQNRQVFIRWIPTSQMPADGFTKPLPRQRHEAFIRMLNLRDIHMNIDPENTKN